MSLDAFIDQALLNNMAQVDIIHGIGTGVIREGVTKYLQRNKHVKSFGYAPQNAGGSGATIVTFKDREKKDSLFLKKEVKSQKFS